MPHRFTTGTHGVVAALLAAMLAACVPVTVNVSFPQEKLDAAARQIEDKTAQPATTPAPAPPPAPTPSGTTSIEATPRLDTRSPEVVKATQSRRERRSVIREWKNRGCIGETNQGTVVARPGDGCGPDVASLIRSENGDRKVVYDAFMRENNIAAADTARVQNAFAKARQERSRANDWIQLDNGQWVRKQ
jgi:uncharacterized protein YdbL (DUF1318 family)